MTFLILSLEMQVEGIQEKEKERVVGIYILIECVHSISA